MARNLGWLLGVLVLLSGCARKPPAILDAEGIVKLNGVPLSKAEIRFVPLDDFGVDYIARGVTDENGRFHLSCKGKSGAAAGSNQVLVMEAELPEELKSEHAQAKLAIYMQSLRGRPIPPRYANLVESPLTANVTLDQKEHQFDLSR